MPALLTKRFDEEQASPSLFHGTCNLDLKIILCAICSVFGIRMFAQAIVFFFAELRWAAIGCFVAALCSFLGIVWVLAGKHSGKAHYFICYGMLVNVFIIHGCLRFHSTVILNWALLATHVSLFCGGATRWCCAALVCVVAAFFTIQTLGIFDCLPHPWPSDPFIAVCTILFETFDIILPACICFLVTWLSMAHRMERQAMLTDYVEKVQIIAQLIVDFDLDAVDHLVVDQNPVLSLLKQVADNLKVYRPYIPIHLRKHCEILNIQSTMAGELAEVHASLSCSSPLDSPPQSPLTVFHGLLGQPSVEQSVPHFVRSSSSLFRLRVPLTLRAPGGMFDISHSRCAGTLLYVKLPLLEAYASTAKTQEDMMNIHDISTAFLTAVETSVCGHQGVMQTIHHDSCLATFNLMSRCPLHSEHACQAAIEIRKRLYGLSLSNQTELTTFSVGIWSGSLVFGGFGTSETKHVGTLGTGVTSVMLLQQYASYSKRCIVANGEVQRNMALAPKVQMMAVDVLCTVPCQNQQDSADTGNSEVVYEVLGESAVEQDELIHQVQSIQGAHSLQELLRQLWNDASNGVRDITSFHHRIGQLTRCADRAVATVAQDMQALLSKGHFLSAYQLTLIHQWQLPQTLQPHRSSSSLVVLSPAMRSIIPPFSSRQLGTRDSIINCQPLSASTSSSQDSDVDVPPTSSMASPKTSKVHFLSDSQRLDEPISQSPSHLLTVNRNPLSLL